MTIIWLLLVWVGPTMDADQAYADVASSAVKCEAEFSEVQKGVTETLNHKCVPVNPNQAET